MGTIVSSMPVSLTSYFFQIASKYLSIQRSVFFSFIFNAVSINLRVALFPLNLFKTNPEGFDSVGCYFIQKSCTICCINSSLSAPEYSSKIYLILRPFEYPESFPESLLFDVPDIRFLLVYSV